ncbi:MAG: lipase family protein [Anaerolineae bacterium]|nr:lipase family protein [Anaerolineae bacterium]
MMKTQPWTKIPVFVVMLVLVHGGISMLFPASLPAEIARFDRYLEEGVDVLYLGDSTLMLPVGEVTTGEILQELLPDRRIAQIAHPAYGLDLFYDYAAHMDRHGTSPQTLILPINLRSFSPAWDMRPAFQFTKESKILSLGHPWARFLIRPLEIFGFFRPSMNQQDFLDAPVYDGNALVGQVRDFETLAAGEVLQEDAENAYREVELADEETAQALLTYHYMLNLEPDHRKLDSMVAVAELAAGRGVDVIFYITPVNVEQGERFLGSRFGERFAENVGVVQSRLGSASQDQVMLLNLAFDLPAYDFTDMEHLTETGKEYVAERIALAIQRELDAPVSSTPEATPTATAAPTLATAAPLPTRANTVSTATPSATPAAPEAVTETVTGGNVTGVRYIDRYRPSGPYPVDMYRMTFETVDEFGDIVETQADLYIPYVEFEEAFPVLGHAAGTTGVGNGCAPLDERTTGRSWGAYHSQSLTYAAQGHIVVFPNWLHFDDPQRIHHYFVSDFQGRTLLDAIRAVYGFWDRGEELDTLAVPAQAVLMMGYSSGGHAIFAAKDRAEIYAPELPIKGVIGFGPVTNPGLLLQEDPIFGPYLVYAYRDFYGEALIDPAEVYLSPWVAEFEDDVLSICVDEIFSYYSHSARRMYEPEFREALYDGRLAEIYPEFAEKLVENTAGLGGGTDIPVLILQGTADTVITPPSQRDFRDQLCALGNSVSLIEYEAATHADTRWRSYRDVLAWMEDAVEGDAPRSDCPPAE